MASQNELDSHSFDFSHEDPMVFPMHLPSKQEPEMQFSLLQHCSPVSISPISSHDGYMVDKFEQKTELHSVSGLVYRGK